jgi:hypothetical protein
MICRFKVEEIKHFSNRFLNAIKLKFYAGFPAFFLPVVLVLINISMFLFFTFFVHVDICAGILYFFRVYFPFTQL